MSKLSYVIEGNLSERQIEADVSRFLGWCSPLDIPFRLLDINEQETGADKLFNFKAMIYIQFKKSTGLKSIAKCPIKARKNESLLQDVRQFRHDCGLADSPSLFFQLRKKAETAHDLQHNILFKYNRPPFSHSIYVAPLTLDTNSYDRMLFDSAGRFMDFPFFSRSMRIMGRKWSSYYGFIPFLRGHVSIVPHEIVPDHNHYYAYSEIGDQITWHSPEIIGHNPSRLSEFMATRYGQVLDSEEKGKDAQFVLGRLREMLIEIGEQPDIILSGESNIEKIQSHGEWIYGKYGIRQFAITE